mgnify:CR=1 FL=1|jgi:hypothetical protein
MKFELGQLVATRGINVRLLNDSDFSKFLWNSFARYKNCDWGDIPHEDKKMNDSAVKNGDDRIVARYNDIYIITEWDRSATTILFIDEY